VVSLSWWLIPLPALQQSSALAMIIIASPAPAPEPRSILTDFQGLLFTRCYQHQVRTASSNRIARFNTPRNSARWV